MRSYKLWQMFAEKVRAQGLDPLQELGWKRTGNYLNLFIKVSEDNFYV
jgi:hypothetical protein